MITIIIPVLHSSQYLVKYALPGYFPENNQVMLTFYAPTFCACYVPSTRTQVIADVSDIINLQEKLSTFIFLPTAGIQGPKVLLQVVLCRTVNSHCYARKMIYNAVKTEKCLLWTGRSFGRSGKYP